ncbi:hypothetical protein EJ03DRAFT_67507 [Teratosphaeria nubilosa]|uniref:Uncharacterized protein n=1 Tax=Teratosphaeria nubilosa TaxID=161662 RepID=A0A6G1LDB3_9PEZI|nr:hypothetical protein EJ03DRAFT_67507 [Teratosphaeria nubilosa]
MCTHSHARKRSGDALTGTHSVRRFFLGSPVSRLVRVIPSWIETLFRLAAKSCTLKADAQGHMQNEATSSMQRIVKAHACKQLTLAVSALRNRKSITFLTTTCCGRTSQQAESPCETLVTTVLTNTLVIDEDFLNGSTELGDLRRLLAGFSEVNYTRPSSP